MPRNASSSITVKTDDLSRDIREEVRKTLELNHDLLDTLVAKVKQTLIDELTVIISQKVAESMKETLDFELAERDEKISKLEKRVRDMENQQDDAEQYSRRNCLIFHGMEEREGEITDDLIQAVCVERLSVKLEKGDIDRSHRLGVKKEKTRGIIIRFSNYNARNAVYQARRVLRRQEGPQIYIQENLTKARNELFWEVKSNHRDLLKSIWTQDGRIKVLTKDDRRVTLTSKAHIKRLTPTT